MFFAEPVPAPSDIALILGCSIWVSFQHWLGCGVNLSDGLPWPRGRVGGPAVRHGITLMAACGGATECSMDWRRLGAIPLAFSPGKERLRGHRWAGLGVLVGGVRVAWVLGLALGWRSAAVGAPGSVFAWWVH